jgi:hypothetical protein
MNRRQEANGKERRESSEGWKQKRLSNGLWEASHIAGKITAFARYMYSFKDPWFGLPWPPDRSGACS